MGKNLLKCGVKGWTSDTRKILTARACEVPCEKYRPSRSTVFRLKMQVTMQRRKVGVGLYRPSRMMETGWRKGATLPWEKIHGVEDKKGRH